MTESDKGSSTVDQNKRPSLRLKTKETGHISLHSHEPAKKYIVEVRSLLSELVNTVAAVLTSRPVHVWQVYGGFQRIYEAILRIFYHGCVHKDTQGNADIWPFIVGLRVINPVLGPSSEVTAVPKPGDKWIHSSLQNLQLAPKITALTADREHVEKHYHRWALFRSSSHITAVETCLKALEENSQDGLAYIDPKLLVGDYYPPPGTPPVNGPPDAAERLLKLKSQLYDPSIGKISALDQTVSLPSTPLADKDWIPAWPYTSQSKVSKPSGIQAFQRSSSQDSSDSKKVLVKSSSIFRGSCHLPVRRGKSEASLQGLRKDVRRPFGTLGGSEQSDNDSFMSRESPDGSSGSSDWPVTSPVSQAVPFIKKDSPQLSSSSNSPIARLVKGELLGRTETGTRPKEFFNNPVIKDPPESRHLLDASDGSEAGSSISPSLLQVNYGGKYLPSDGDASSPHGSVGTCSLDARTPQLRRRPSGGRINSTHADSDQDSEETVDGNSIQGTRRRKRSSISQHRSSMSVKHLVDSRGVLCGEVDCAPKNHVKNLVNKQCTTDNEVRELCLEAEKKVSLQTMVTPGHLSASAQLAKEVISKPKSENISTPAKAIGSEITGILASSAPGTVVKSSESPYDTLKSKKKTHSRSRSDGSQEISGKLRLATSNTAPALEMGIKLEDATLTSHIRKRFMDDGGHSITPAADYGVSPRPQPGQSLIGFLASKDKPYAELDRENAHFNISEAVIAALTQMQFDVWQGKTETGPSVDEESDEEIRLLEARIQEKRRLKQASSTVPNVKPGSVANSTVNPQQWARSQQLKGESTTDYSMYESPQSSTYNSESDLLSELEEEDSENPSSKGNAPKCISRKTSSSDPPPIMGDLLSAEGVAINLLKRFSEQKLPKASELDWLISEQEVPQKLLPLPTSVAVSPDDAGAEKNSEIQLQLRGTFDWAPPRPQLILTLHTNTKRAVLMGIQRWRCAGCGMRVSESLSRHFRLCNYLGRYFCTTCHRNQTAMIPAKVLHKWDFRLYAVASFSFELLERMKIDPLINVGALNPRLYKKCRHLHQTHIYRLQLYHTLPYINTCSRAHNEKMSLGKLPLHWASDPHIYSLEDLDCIRAGQLVNIIKDVTSVCIRHISKCEVCLGRGFICEICCRGEAIFPFQLDSTSLCEICSACFHSGCFSPNRCPRCIRRESRRMSHEMLGGEDFFEKS
ncbi:run domain Beclin-1-interacting and cysteine-rich domain-containing protein [Palaemon carinicauda]|uniref:run domain Beclin-1-interacting and cysteine-rich domain-containing protein n=1 Tax=Palaemon carinicauda TaxID=392227 RepID=UPI0035B6321E